MFKIIRYLLSISIAVFAVFILKNKKAHKFKSVKIIFNFAVSIIIMIMPFENLFLKFDSPEQAFKYTVGSNNNTIIKTIENENTSLIIYNESGDIKATIINNCNEKWKAPFLPNKQELFTLKDNSIVLITRERKSNNFYIMILVKSDIEIVSDNKNSVFETFSDSDKWKNFVTYVENCDDNYIIIIDENEYRIM